MSTIQERRQDASASKGIEGFAFNRQILKWNPRGFEAQPLIRRKQAATLRTVLDLGPLTVEEVRTVNGELRYKFKAREDKRVNGKMLNKIRLQLTKELERIGELKDVHAYKREYEKAERAAETPEQKKQRNKDRYAKIRQREMLRKQKERDEQKALKAAMLALPKNEA